MERQHRAAIVTFFSEPDLSVGEFRLSDDAAGHARARRMSEGDAVRLVDGVGRIGTGQLIAFGKNQASVRVDHVERLPRPNALEVIVPVADRDRMLLAAEKCVELQITAWRPTYFARSRSVAPRGEGPRFRDKVRARMRAALEQSGGAWLPELHDESDVKGAFAAIPSSVDRYILDASGEPFQPTTSGSAVALAVGPEGGFEESEVAAALAAGWRRARLSSSTLRFETAIIGGVAVVRAAQQARNA